MITYDTYGGKFHTPKIDSMGFLLVKFDSNKKLDFDIMMDYISCPQDVC